MYRGAGDSSMYSSLVREYIMNVGSVSLAIWLIASTLGGRRRPSASDKTFGPVRRLEETARLTFGSGLLFLAFLLLIGSVLSAQGVSLQMPGWVIASGAVLLIVVGLAGVTVLVFHIPRRGRPGPR
jgi:hypothetical protein